MLFAVINGRDDADKRHGSLHSSAGRSRRPRARAEIDRRSGNGFSLESGFERVRRALPAVNSIAARPARANAARSAKSWASRTMLSANALGSRMGVSRAVRSCSAYSLTPSFAAATRAHPHSIASAGGAGKPSSQLGCKKTAHELYRAYRDPLEKEAGCTRSKKADRSAGNAFQRARLPSPAVARGRSPARAGRPPSPSTPRDWRAFPRRWGRRASIAAVTRKCAVSKPLGMYVVRCSSPKAAALRRSQRAITILCIGRNQVASTRFCTPPQSHSAG